MGTLGSNKKLRTVMKVLDYRFIRLTYLIVRKSKINALCVSRKLSGLQVSRECLIVSDAQG